MLRDFKEFYSVVEFMDVFELFYVDNNVEFCFDSVLFGGVIIDVVEDAGYLVLV